MPKTIIEPFRIKVVEPLGQTTREERRSVLEKAATTFSWCGPTRC